ncbi:MAG: hypothetical protein H0W81_11900 [Chloroflexi bacterium]|nr:hypothetical protein [Chloroflexota bacterium]
MGRTLSSEEARVMSLRARSYAAAEIATVALGKPKEIADPLNRIAARLIVTTGADATPLATGLEVQSWND